MGIYIILDIVSKSLVNFPFIVNLNLRRTSWSITYHCPSLPRTKLRDQNLAIITQLVTKMALEPSDINYIILYGNSRKWLILKVEWEVGGGRLPKWGAFDLYFEEWAQSYSMIKAEGISKDK